MNTYNMLYSIKRGWRSRYCSIIRQNVYSSPQFNVGLYTLTWSKIELSYSETLTKLAPRNSVNKNTKSDYMYCWWRCVHVLYAGHIHIVRNGIALITLFKGRFVMGIEIENSTVWMNLGNVEGKLANCTVTNIVCYFRKHVDGKVFE